MCIVALVMSSQSLLSLILYSTSKRVREHDNGGNAYTRVDVAAHSLISLITMSDGDNLLECIHVAMDLLVWPSCHFVGQGPEHVAHPQGKIFGGGGGCGGEGGGEGEGGG